MDFGALYQGIVETSPDGIWVFDLEGRTLYANPEIARMFGVDESEVMELTVFDSLDADGRAQFAAHLPDLRSGNFHAGEVEATFVRRDGSTIWILVAESALLDEDGELIGILHRIRDYTNRRQILDELRLSEQRLAEVEAPASPTPPVAAPRSKRHRVLVVEDNVVNQLVATGMLESLGYEVETADDGVFALESMAGGGYDVVLMALSMPRMDGYAATRAIRTREPHGVRIPVIAMTAAAIEGERERCLAAGMDDFLTKPMDQATLGSVLADWLGHGESAPSALGPDPVDNPVATTPALGAMEGLDTERLDMLRDLDPGNTTYLDRAIGNFLVNSRTAVETIRETIAAADAHEMRQAAHKLAGSALNLGISYGGAAAREIEWLADAGTTVGASELVPLLEEALDRGRTALLAYQATYGDANDSP